MLVIISLGFAPTQSHVHDSDMTPLPFGSLAWPLRSPMDTGPRRGTGSGHRHRAALAELGCSS